MIKNECLHNFFNWCLRLWNTENIRHQMKITVERITSDPDTTISIIFIDGVFECFGLEDEYREDKVFSETRIPAGRYKIGVRTIGGFHRRYSKKFIFHRGMLEVLDVPNFEYILLHVGNTDDDTAGCLLVGVGANSKIGDMAIQSSVAAYRKLYSKVIEEALAGRLTIEYIDRDLP